MIRIGTMAMMVAAMPVSVYFTARRENEMPRKGPKNDPRAMTRIPFPSLTAFRIRRSFFKNQNNDQCITDHGDDDADV